MSFKQAVRTQAKARIVLVGPSGSGKSMTALRIARGLIGPNGKIAARDSEHGSLSKYALAPGESPSDRAFVFDVDEPATHSPLDYVQSIHDAETAGYDCIVIDSLSHAWVGEGGALELVDQATARANSKNAFTSGWSVVTPMHNQMISAICSSQIHVIATMRTKTEYVLETRGDKQVPRKVGMAPIQRDGMEYEFDLIGTLDRDHRMVIDKTRCAELDGVVIEKPGFDVGQTLAVWLGSGVPMLEKPPKEMPRDSRKPDKPAGLTASEKAVLNEASIASATDMLEEAATREIAKAPQDLDAMRKALRLAVLSFLQIDRGLIAEDVPALLAAFANARLHEDGTVQIEAEGDL